MYFIPKDVELTTFALGRIIKAWNSNELNTLNTFDDYFNGRQAILQKHYQDPTKNCNHIVKNYCLSIVNNYLGYLTGIPVSYKSENEALMDAMNYNDYENEDVELLKDALVYGVSYEILYIDEDGKERFKVINPKSIIPIYDDTLNGDLIYAVRLYQKDDWFSEGNDLVYYAQVYTEDRIITYKTDKDYSNFVLEDEQPHYFGQVPLVEFDLNEERKSIFADIMTMQDAYNELISAEVDEVEAFNDAYLVLKGADIDEDDAENMRENRILILDEDADASYLTKNISDAQIENMLTNLNDSIHVIANSPDFNDEKFMAASGVAMRFKLTGMENQAASIVNRMTKALRKRVELLYAIFGLKNLDAFADVEITFTRNLPVDVLEIVNEINALRGIVSDRTLIGLLPFIKNADVEIEAVNEQKMANMNMYSFTEQDINSGNDKDDVNDN